MSVPEQIGKVAVGVVEGLKSNPSCLAAITLAAIFAVLTYMSLTAERKEMHERQLLLIEKCFIPYYPPQREKN